MTLSDAVLAVRGSVARTKSERTAVIRFKGFNPGQAWSSADPPTAAGLPPEWGGDRPGVSLDEDPEVLGAIDFQTSRSLHHESGQGWSIYEPGREVMGEDDEWEEPFSYARIAPDEPFWLIELVAGAIEAEVVASTDQDLDRYAVLANLGVASRAAGRVLAVDRPFFSPDEEAAVDLEQEHVKLDLWLNTSGRIRRVARAGDERDAIELGDFGAPIHIEFPPAEKIWRAIDHLENWEEQ